MLIAVVVVACLLLVGSLCLLVTVIEVHRRARRLALLSEAVQANVEAMRDEVASLYGPGVYVYVDEDGRTTLVPRNGDES